jgi:hypothetical protein
MTVTPHFIQMTVHQKIANTAQKVSLNFKTQTININIQHQNIYTPKIASTNLLVKYMTLHIGPEKNYSDSDY